MSIVEAVEKLQMDCSDKEVSDKYYEALRTYHQLIKDGIISPRENQLDNTYHPQLSVSNYSINLKKI